MPQGFASTSSLLYRSSRAVRPRQLHLYRGRSPTTAHVAEEFLPCELVVLFIQSTRRHRGGETVAERRHSGSAHTISCSVQPSSVHEREKEQGCSVSIPAHFASILRPLFTRETHSLARIKTKVAGPPGGPGEKTEKCGSANALRVCYLLKYLLKRCSRGGRGIVEDMCYERRRAEACVD
jgi:hypothetical protein